MVASTVTYEYVGRFIPEGRRLGARPYLAGIAACYTHTRCYADSVFDNQIEPGTATGIFLDLVGSTYGVRRTAGELDDMFRIRMLAFDKGVTYNSVLECVNDILALGGYPTASVTEWHAGSHFLGIEDANIGFFVGQSRLPLVNGFIINLPEGTDEVTCASVFAFVSDRRAVGFQFLITTDKTPVPGFTMDNTSITMDSTSVTMDNEP